MTCSNQAISLPKRNGRGGVCWSVETEGEVFTVTAFIDSAYGPEAPLFALPDGEDRLMAASAVDTAFEYWMRNRDEVDPLLSAAAAELPEAHRVLLPCLLAPDAEIPVTLVPETEHHVVVDRPPEVTDQEEILLPLIVDGRQVTGVISMHRLPGISEKVEHIGAYGADLETISIAARFVSNYVRENRSFVDTMLADSRQRRIAAGIADEDVARPRTPHPRVPTSARVSRLFRTSRGRIVFTVVTDGTELLVDADSWGNFGGPSGDECNAVVYFILDNSDLLTAMGLNVEPWEAWR